jgi:ABC-2 type transport system ATP-binding protein
MLRVGRELNPHWDDDLAHSRLARLGIPLDQKIGKLSGGQQAQVALTLALAKRPELLVLDEPVASLDPLARREFLQSLMEAVAEGGLTVVLSSHIVAELERVCDHLVILAAGGIRLAGSIEEIVASHRLLTGPRAEAATIARTHAVVQSSHTERQTTLFVRANGQFADPRWQIEEVGLEDIVLAYLGQMAEAPIADPWKEEVAS